MMDIPRGFTSRRSLLTAGLTAGGLILVPPAAAYATRIEDPPVDPGDPTEPHHDVTQVTPEDLVPPDGLDPGACGSTIWQHNEILGFVTPYEPDGDGATNTFYYNAAFYNRIETWFRFFRANTPIAWGPPFQIRTYGVYVNRGDGCSSYHNFGRAFDLSRIYATDPATRTLHQVFNARYDQWRSQTGSALTTTRKRYWATAASVHYHFRSTLTYLYNTAHHNHIHFDNGVSGSGNTAFSSGSSAQVEHVQACLVYVWGQSLAIDGIWGPQSSAAAGRVLARIGRSGSLGTQSNWLEFNRATLRFGSGTQTY
jgi:hypothetical protein